MTTGTTKQPIKQQEEAQQHLTILQSLCDGLDEKPNTQAYWCLNRAIRVLGPKACIVLAHEALRVFNGEGMLTKQGKPRTLGGIFFKLMKEHTTPEQRQVIFKLNERKRKGEQVNHLHEIS